MIFEKPTQAKFYAVAIPGAVYLIPFSHWRLAKLRPGCQCGTLSNRVPANNQVGHHGAGLAGLGDRYTDPLIQAG